MGGSTSAPIRLPSIDRLICIVFVRALRWLHVLILSAKILIWKRVRCLIETRRIQEAADRYLKPILIDHRLPPPVPFPSSVPATKFRISDQLKTKNDYFSQRDGSECRNSILKESPIRVKVNLWSWQRFWASIDGCVVSDGRFWKKENHFIVKGSMALNTGMGICCGRGRVFCARKGWKNREKKKKGEKNGCGLQGFTSAYCQTNRFSH